jgi:HAD superfamily hydrolase (TIGR01509 family)
MIDAVIFDLDGVLVESEQVWTSSRQRVAREHGGRWQAGATREMMGMSSPEWSRYMHDELGVALEPPAIVAEVVRHLEHAYRTKLPLIPGARETVVSLTRRFKLGLASSANRTVLELVLELAGLRDCFLAAESAEEVMRGKPHPDVYLEVARSLGERAEACAAVEDSSNGLRAAARAGMLVIAYPSREFPPDAEALALAHVVITSLDELRAGLIERVAAGAH